VQFKKKVRKNHKAQEQKYLSERAPEVSDLDNTINYLGSYHRALTLCVGVSLCIWACTTAAAAASTITAACLFPD
jgi:hypothetical protein